jgi:hypothetical protein
MFESPSDIDTDVHVHTRLQGGRLQMCLLQDRVKNFEEHSFGDSGFCKANVSKGKPQTVQICGKDVR